MNWPILFVIFCYVIVSSNGLIYTVSNLDIKEKISSTGLLGEKDDQLLLISTLDGVLHAVDKATGKKKWTLKDDPIIQNPHKSEPDAIPRFFPNPQDGSLYRYTMGGGGRDPLKKLPFTIPELVANSPCRSSDGIFYTGKKTDSYIVIDVFTGKKQFVLAADSTDKVCPKPSRNTAYIGRTLYSVTFYELSSGNKWNVSFYDYATHNDRKYDHDQYHFAATGEGSVLTYDLKSGLPLWLLDLGSPVVAVYYLATDNTLFPVTLTAINPGALEKFSYSLDKYGKLEHAPIDALEKDFKYTTYVGECENGVYAVPALIDSNTARISAKENHLLLDGPEGQRGVISTKEEPNNDSDVDDSDVIILGYYDTVESSDMKMDRIWNTIRGIPLGITHRPNITLDSHLQNGEKSDIITNGLEQVKGLNVTFIFSRDFVVFCRSAIKKSYHWVFEAPLNTLVTLVLTLLVVVVALIFVAFQNQARLVNEMSSRRNASSSKGSKKSWGGGEITAVAEELETGEIRVGKITFDPKALLGKGCDGTSVYKGRFDGRQIAVKRVLPSCFSIADREVDLLRASDQHSNVVRYYCMEQCREFRYIALEFCAATLEDLICERFRCDVPHLVLLAQATAGVSHLHSLDIVHRDIKPHNVLISTPNAKNEVRAMISDFGLCKKLEGGRNSFSKRSGVTGTDGWIAPEMINNSMLRPTMNVDIFSLGCVFYYVLTNGRHPFGRLLDRQSNISNDKANLSHLDDESDVLSKSLIEHMVKNKDSDRPPCSAVMVHPLFWSADRILQFFQDVSDRIEKESLNSYVLRILEAGSNDVVREDWTKHIHQSIGEDLRRFRDYNGRSVRDLLRALRNKKNHYRELSLDAIKVFGNIPDDFVRYWTQLFPRLLLHSWYSLQVCQEEPIFSKYYSAGYTFRKKELHQTISLSPNNRRPGGSDFPDPEPPRIPIAKKLFNRKKKDTYDFLDSILGPQTVKGPRQPPKHESNLSPAWVIRKPSSAFKPNFVYENIKIKDESEEQRKKADRPRVETKGQYFPKPPKFQKDDKKSKFSKLNCSDVVKELSDNLENKNE